MLAARSIGVYAVYLLLLGLGLVAAPNLILTAFGFAPTSEVWIRVVGALVLTLAFFYGMAARTGDVAFARWTVVARLFVPVAFTAFVALGWAAWMLVLFGLVDLVGALWTWRALRSG